MNPGDIWCPNCMTYHQSVTVCPRPTAQPPQSIGKVCKNCGSTKIEQRGNEIWCWDCGFRHSSGQDEAIDYKKFYNDVHIHFEMLCTEEIRAHACADISHDLAFQVFRVLGGYLEALEENAAQRAQGRQEAAEAYCWALCHKEEIEGCKANEGCYLYKAILGIASKEKG